MDWDPDETVCYLRTELHELLDDMKELKYSSVDEFARWMETTRDDEAYAQIQIKKPQRQKDSMSNLKTRLIEKSPLEDAGGVSRAGTTEGACPTAHLATESGRE
jgi:hypothetical protein